MTPDRTPPTDDLAAGSFTVDACWSALVGPIEDGVDLRTHGVSSLDLLGFELELRRCTNRIVSLDKIDGPITLSSVRSAVESAPVSTVEPRPQGRDGSIDPPATAAQASQWLAERLRPGNRGYLVPLVVELPEGTTWRDLSTAVRTLVHRHAALRTGIVPVEGDPGSLRQVVTPGPGMVVIEPRSVPDVDDESIGRLIEGMGGNLPSVSGGHPWRACGLMVDGRLRSLLFLLHHVTVDDPSLRMIVHELHQELNAVASMDRDLEIPSAAPTDQRDTGLRESLAPPPEEEIAWWGRWLDQVPVRLDLRSVTDADDRDRRRTAFLDPEAVRRLDARIREAGGVRTAAVLRAVRVAAAGIGIAPEGSMPIGVPMSRRDHPDDRDTVGMYLNTLPIPVAADDSMSSIAAAIREGRSRRTVAFESILRSTEPIEPIAGRVPWLDFVVGVVEGDREPVAPLPWRVASTGHTPFPILLIARFEIDGCRLELDVDPAWIRETDADELLAAVLAELDPDVHDLAQAEVSVCEGEPLNPGTLRALPEIVRQAATEDPTAPAVRDQHGEWTFKQLDELGGRLAVSIRARVSTEFEPGSPIAILGGPSRETSLAVLAAMRAGGAAMPIPPEAPISRVADLLRRSRPAAVVVSSPELVEIANHAIDASRLSIPLVVVEDPPAANTGGDLPSIDPDQACYVLFTSGSTGEPKAVRMHHGGLAGLIEHERRRTPATVAVRTGQFAPLGFDVAFQELFSTWASRGAVISIPLDVRRDPTALARFIEAEGITRLHLPPLVLRALAAGCRGGFPDCLREIVCAGEQLRIDDGIRLAVGSMARPLRIVNQYGPTETHVATHFDLGTEPSTWPALPSIGSPIDGVRIRIEDEQGASVTVGESGEIVIEGDAVALGYLGDSTGGFEVDDARGRRYRTGDRGKIGRRGGIEFLGRSDRQMKISGYRVEPGEIEAALVELEPIRDAAVLTVAREEKSDSVDSPRLLAFVTGPASTEELADCLHRIRDRLPPWMVPDQLQAVDALPRSSNGKVDRSRLRRTVTVRTIRPGNAGWTVSDVLGRLADETVQDEGDQALEARSLGIMGIDSLGAIRLQLALLERHGVELPVARILGLGLSELRGLLKSTVDAEKPAESGTDLDSSPTEAQVAEEMLAPEEWYPLDPLVRDVLAEEALAAEGAFHLAWTIRFPRSVPIEDIGRRLALVRRRHPTLRTARRAELGELLIPIADSVPFDLEAFDERPTDAVLARVLRHPLRIADGLPWRMATWPESDGTTSLLVVIHHAAVDGRTAQRIIEEIITGQEHASSEPDSPLVSVECEADDAWWTEHLRSTLGETGLPDPDFDGVVSRAVAIDHRGGTIFRRAADVAAGLGMARIVPALVAWAIVLGRASGREKVVIGVPFATDLDETGLGASILPVAIAIEDDRSLQKTLREVALTIGEGLDHRNGALGRIVRDLEPDSSFVRPPLDGVLTRDDVVRHFEGASIRWTSTGAGVFRAALVVPAEDGAAPVAVDVEPSVLDGEEPETFLNRVMSMLERIHLAMQDSEGPASLLGDLDGLDAVQRSRIEVFGRGDDDRPPPLAPSNIIEGFLRRVGIDSDAPAVIDRDGTISYRELDLWSASIAAELRGRVGEIHGRAIAVAGPRSAATIAGMIAVVRAGGWFVPLDEGTPPERQAAQIDASRPLAALVVGGDVSRIPGITTVIDPRAIRGLRSDFEDVVIDGDSPFYAMFTSGTTGEPRGAVIPHRAVLRLVDDPWFLPGGPGFRMLHAAPLAFDASTLEIWWPLLNGGTICCWEGGGADLGGLHARMRRDEVRGCWLTAAIFHLAVDAMPEFFQDLDVVLTGGDVVSADHVRRLLDRRPEIALIDGYGPTENTVFTACESLVAGGVDRTAIPVGRPIRGSRLRIVDRSGRDVPPGRFGELLATGTGVGLGYLGRDGTARVQEGFERNPRTGEVQYRTGDRARWQVDGRIEFGGRLDAQVKVSGRRIELGAIETMIRSLPGIRDACATLLDDGDRSRLASVVVAEPEREIDAAGIRSALAGRLPEWEVPAVIRILATIPVTRNGKPDRRRISEALLEMNSEEDSAAEARASVVRPREGELLEIVRKAIAEIASRPSVGSRQSLREIGLDSLDLLRLAIELECRVARPVAMVDVLEGGSAMAIASRIAEEIDREDADLVSLQVGASPHGRGLYCIPGVGGTVFSFQSIVDGLPEWLPIHGLPYPGTAGRAEPLRRIPDMARIFADRIIAGSGQASVLLGYSLGGFVAFEVARALAASGPPPKVVVIDSAPLGLASRRSLASRVMNPGEWKMRFQNVLPAGILDRMGGNARGRTLQSLRGVVAAGFEAMRQYDPEPAPIDVTVLRTTETDFGSVGGTRDLGWSTLARSVEVVEIPTSHLECFRGGSMDLARVVRAIVERSVEGG